MSRTLLDFSVVIACLYASTAFVPPGHAQATSSEHPNTAEEVAAPPQQNAEDDRNPDGAQPYRSIDELLLFFPSKYPDGDWKPSALRFEDVWFSAYDGTRLHGWYCPSKDPRAIVLFAHGNAGNITHRSALLRRLQSQLQITTFAFDYRGYGRSKGTPTVEAVIDDARAARVLLAKRAEIPESNIVLMGRSLGGAIVIQLAAERSPRGLILENTFSSLRDVAEVHYPALSWLVPQDKLDSASKLPEIETPLLQSHGTADRTVPIRLGVKLFRAGNEPKTFVRIPGGGHNAPRPQEYYRQLHAFVGRLPSAEK